MRDRHRLLGAAVLVGGWAFVFLFHRAPDALLFDYPWVAYNLGSLPMSVDGMLDAIRWQASVHSPRMARPVRAVLWGLVTAGLDCRALGYHVLNGVTLGAVTWAAWYLATALTDSARRALVVALGVSATYATAFPLLFFGYGQPALFGYLGLAAWFRAETRGGSGARWLRAIAVVLLLLAAFSHETYLAYALVPLLHAAVVRRARAAVTRAAALLTILPAYGVVRALLIETSGSGSSWTFRILGRALDAPDRLVENPGRVGFAVLTGGLPLDPLRALPWFPEFARLREMMLAPAGLVTMVVVVVPALGLAALALAAARHDVLAGRRALFALLWLAIGSLPLMLPLGTPEAVHLTGALPALFLLWSEAFVRGAGRRALGAAVVLLLVWAGVHLGARFILFRRDVPAISRAVHALHRVFLDAHRSGTRAVVLFLPVQIGGHYGMLPTVPALYPEGPGGCVRGTRPAGCLVEPVWIWSTLRRPPSLPPACRTSAGLRVGPIDAAMAKELDGSRRMLGHSGITLTDPGARPVMGLCPLRGIDADRVDGAWYRLYRMDATPEARWYRFDPEGGEALRPVDRCPGS